MRRFWDILWQTTEGFAGQGFLPSLFECHRIRGWGGGEGDQVSSIKYQVSDIKKKVQESRLLESRADSSDTRADALRHSVYCPYILIAFHRRVTLGITLPSNSFGYFISERRIYPGRTRANISDIKERAGRVEHSKHSRYHTMEFLMIRAGQLSTR